MNLWIRSQDKESLFKIESLFYSTDKDNKHLIRTIVVPSLDNGIIQLGKYSSKERCIEILDEVQAIIDTKKAMMGEFADREVAKILIECQKLSTVYEMPKE